MTRAFQEEAMPAETERERQTKTAEAAQIGLGREGLRERGVGELGAYYKLSSNEHICAYLHKTQWIKR